MLKAFARLGSVTVDPPSSERDPHQEEAREERGHGDDRLLRWHEPLVPSMRRG
jgi:hypothetical protein